MNDPTLLSIKAFSKYTGVNQSTLRYYDEIGLIKPVERGEENNYRYYRPSQSMTLSFINVLIDLGVSLTDIKEMSDGRTPEGVIELLSRQETILDRKLNEIQTAYSIIHTFRKNIQSGLFAPVGEIRVEDMEDAHFILGAVNEFKENGTFYEPFMKFCNSAGDFRINLRYPIGGYHYDIDSFMNAPGQPDKFFSLDPLGNCKRSAGKYLVGYARGYYGEFGDLPQRMAHYAKEHNLLCSGPVYTLYLLDEVSVSKTDEYLARVSVCVSECKPLKSKRCNVKKICVKPHCE